MTFFHRSQTPHQDWCARDHRCGLDEHRSPEVIADRAGGRAVITRVRAGDVEYAEVNVRIPLHADGARWQVGEVLRLMRDLLAAVALRPGVLHTARRAAAIRANTATRFNLGAAPHDWIDR